MPNRHERRKSKSKAKKKVRKFYFPKDIGHSSIIQLSPEWWFCGASRRWWPPNSSVVFDNLNIPIPSRPAEEGEEDLPLTIVMPHRGKSSWNMLKDGKEVKKTGSTIKLPDPLKDLERGLIITPKAVIDKESIELDPKISPRKIRDSLLFWDRISIPFSNILGVDIGDDGRFLRKEGLLSTPIFEAYGEWDMSEVASKAFLDPFNLLNQRDGERWSIGSDSDSAKFVGLPEVDRHGLLLRLHAGIPVPQRDIPLEDILHFREKRAAERLSFRAKMDDLYRSLSQRPDEPLDEKREIDGLQDELVSYIRVAREAQIPIELKEIGAKICDKTFYGAAGGYSLGSKALELSPALASLLGITGATFASVQIGLGLRHKRDTSNPYEYVWQINSQI